MRLLTTFIPILGATLALLATRQSLAHTAESPAGATISVNSYVDWIADDGFCTLREAIIAANTDTPSGVTSEECPAGAGVDTILLPGGVYTLSLTNSPDTPQAGDLDITSQIVLTPLPGFTAKIFADDNADRAIEISTTGKATLSSLWIYGGADTGWGGGGISNSGELTLTNASIYANFSSANGGGLSNNSSGKAHLSHVGFGNNLANIGGCIANTGNLTLSQVSLTFCSATNGAGLSNNSPGEATLSDLNISANTASNNGGGISNSGWLTFTRVTINGNEATNGDGGGIYHHDGIIQMENITLSDNSADSGLGGGFNRNGGTGLLTNVTIANNSAGLGGGLRAAASGISVKNVLLANNSGGNCRIDTGALASLGNNLSSDNTCDLGLNQPSDQNNTGDPLLGPLQDNGGKTETHALLPGSPAIDQGSSSGCPLTDQRGYLRPADGDADGVVACDIGAYEVVPLTFLPLLQR
ncbi:MAG: CSLREA domain-containing protein [Anaerolineales bacterium]|nr:CSLREA domain-containing protein [Anaerolineales bacterium]